MSMHVEYALQVLKEDRLRLLKALEWEKKGIKENPKSVTRFKHQLASLDFAIELLETWED